MINYDGTTPTAACHSFNMRVTEEGEKKEYGKQSRMNSRRFLFGLFSRKKEHVHSEDLVVCNEILLPQPQIDYLRCFCHTIFESFGYHYRRPEISHTQDKIDSSVHIDTKKKNGSIASENQLQSQVSNQFSSAFTKDIMYLTQQQEDLVRKMAEDILETIPELEQRTSSVPWGGPQQQAETITTTLSYDWYALKTKRKKRGSASAPLDQIDGGNLFSSYLRIMKWPTDLSDTDFPFKLCRKKKKVESGSCDASVAILHTLEYRERYKPWMITPSIKKANNKGFVYQRGFSPPYSGEDENGSHAIVVLRLSRRVTPDDKNGVFFIRAMIKEFDQAVAASLQRSNGRVGKFNAVVDGKDFTWSTMPSIGIVKSLVTILQDHFADRLGVIILVNIGPICEILLKIFLSLITEEVRNKILMLPHDQKERMITLETVLGKDNIPIWLGGTDNFVFQVDEYYAKNKISLDDEALEYLTTMPLYS